MGRAATGIKVDRRGRLFVSGAGSKFIRIYDVRTGDEIKSYPLPASQFINDVTLTRQGAYFTDSRLPVLYFIPFERKGALGQLQTLALGGEWVQDPDANNANGIVSTRDGKTLILVKSNTGEAFTVPAVRSGTAAAKRFPVTGGDGELINTDGLLLKGRTLYAVENRDEAPEGIGEVTAVKLSGDLTSGRIVKEIHDEDFEVPSTIAASKRGLYVVNAKFNIATPTPDTPYEVVRVPKK
jgi:sugar lactone lactonase YvrE